jgi:hypothetical protein
MKKQDALVRNSADRGQVRRARQKERSFDRTKVNDLLAVLSLPEGRRFLWDVIKDCGVYRSSYLAAVNPEGTAFNEGRRSIGLNLIVSINEADPLALATMGMEAAKKEATEASVRGAMHIKKGDSDG